MKAWMQTMRNALGIGLIFGGGTLLIGCSGAFTVRAKATGLIIEIEAEYTPLQENAYDLDGLEYYVIESEGVVWWFYPSGRLAYNPATGQLIRLSPATYHRLLKLLGLRFAEEPQQHLTPTEVETKRQFAGIFTPNFYAGMGLLDEKIQIELFVQGDMPTPVVDERRWPSLNQELFVFPDGVEGSPDPMRLELEGDSSDVFGYMAAIGVKDAFGSFDGFEWTAVFDENQWVDVFVNDSLFTSIPLH